MSGFGGFGGFGQTNNNNNNQQSSGFGSGFGQASNPTSGFGSTTNNTGFGSNTNAGGSLFGGTGGGFGSSGVASADVTLQTTSPHHRPCPLLGSSGTRSTNLAMIELHGDSEEDFENPIIPADWDSQLLDSDNYGSSSKLLTNPSIGAFGTPQQSTGFGAKPAFGASTSTSGGLFGSNAATANTGSAFGGFGSTNAATSSPFGSTGTGGGLFGQANKPAFGAAGNATSSPFGGGTTTGFGSTTSTFGATGTALGANVGDCQGTGAVPFQPYVEKEPNSASNQQNSFQSIVFQQPYQKFSPEELRLADYAQGRKFANASGQAGAFGASSGFGGFGNNNAPSAFGTNNNTGTGLFGSNPASTPFGQNTPSTGSAFGSTNTGGLFGNKPATGGGLFGAQAQPASGTGLFGSTGTTAFGSTNTGGFGSTTNTGTSLFGNNNQNKSGFSFGTQQPATTGTGFGATNTGTTGGFGSGTSLFGNNTAAQNTSTPFGGTNQAASNPFGGFGQNTNTQTGTTSLFGNNQQKPAGSLFGNNTNTSAGTSLFGNTTNTASNPFGGNNSNAQTTGLFAPKPAPTLGTSGLFGNSINNTATSNTGGLFGSTGGFGQNNQNQQNQNTGSSLFGGLNQQQPKPSLFGGTQSQSGGNSLFGNNTNAQGGSSLFGNLNTNQNQPPQQQQTSLFGGSFGGSQQNQQSQPQSLTASISDPTAFGTSMFSNLGTPQVQNPGPLATPLSSMSKQKKSSVIPMYKMNPASSSRFNTPQKRGFGFSYSTYGTPGSASSTSSTPLTFGNSMLGGGLSRGLSKSVSTSSLRGSYTSTFNREDSILAPGAFSVSPSSRFNSTGSMKKLVINRGIRTDLFSPPSKESPPSSNQSGILKKRVSFDASTVGGNANGHINGNSPLKQVQSSATPSSETSADMRSSTRTGSGNNNRNGNGPKANQIASPPEMEQVKGNELAIVPEEESAPPALSKPRAKPTPQVDQEPGRYWMKPSKDDIMNMNRMQRQKVTGFTVGRDGVGQVAFDVPVDLTNVDLDGIFDKLVILNVRQATVYPDQSKKPPVGKALNVPSTIKLENSWPRGKDKRNPSHEKAGPRFQKHIERLSKVPDTEFIDYDKETGVWTFTVEHFTTYGLEYDDDETDGEAMSDFGQSTLSAPPDTPTPQSRGFREQAENSFSSAETSGSIESDPEDTFDFKKKKILPGAFDNQAAFEEDADMEDEEQDSRSFLDEGSVGSQSEDSVEDPRDQDGQVQDQELVRIEDQEMAGSYPQLDNTAEHDDEYSQGDNTIAVVDETPGAIMRARMRAIRSTSSHLKRKIKFDDNDWAEMLRQSVSPQKQDREQLKRMRDSINNGALLEGDELNGAANSTMRGRVVSDGRGFATSIDLMHSLFGEARSPVKSAKVLQKGKSFEWPYVKQSKTSDLNESDMDESERAFHYSLKPSWDINGTLVYAAPKNRQPLSRNSRRSHDRDDLLVVQKGKVVSEVRDIMFAHFSKESSINSLKKQKSITIVTSEEDVPYASLPPRFKYSEFFEDGNLGDQAIAHEKLVWELASVLFDTIEIPSDLKDVPTAVNLLRKDIISAFWQRLVGEESNRFVAMAKSSEEKAIACLSGRRISEACGHLLNGKNFHLATLVALIGGNARMKKNIREQLNEWQKSKVLSEFSQPIRTIYELLAGNVCVCDGTKGAPIEDRIETFIISKRFGLDWRQAFGLRLWYAILGSDDIARAVELFMDDLEQEKETARPQAWYVEQGISPLWEDEALNSREDLLWGLLKIYAKGSIDLESVLRPENSQLSPLNFRLSWQLSRALIASGQASYGENGDDKADRLTLSFASQLTNEGNWIDAAFVLLHLSTASVRAKAIQDHLAHHAGRIGPEDGHTFVTLVQDLKIPGMWVWEAKALYMRSVQKDPRGEVECLLHAKAYDEAHRTFSREVAPTTVIERDWDTLRSLLTGFRGQEASIAQWHLGGELYADYLHVVESQKKGIGKVDSMALERLLAALPAMAEDGRHSSLLERVAVQEISGVVAKLVVETGKQGNNKDLSRVLRLPLTEDKYLKHTADLSLGYFRSIMASGR